MDASNIGPLLQNYNCHKEGTIFRSLSPEQQESEDTKHFMQRVAECCPRWTALQRACRWVSVGAAPALGLGSF